MVVSFSLPACQDGEVSRTQVCQFQCDYQQRGTEPGYPAATVGVEARLTVQDVVQVIANAIFEAEANGIPDITIVVLDHLSNVLAVYDTDAATTNYSLITSVESPNRTANTPFIVENNGGSANFTAIATNAGLTSLQTPPLSTESLFRPATPRSARQVRPTTSRPRATPSLRELRAR